MDDVFTAPRNGHDDVEAYYAANSSGAFLEDVRRPTLMIHAKDDRFVPVRAVSSRAGSSTPSFACCCRRAAATSASLPGRDWSLRKIEQFFEAG